MHLVMMAMDESIADALLKRSGATSVKRPLQVFMCCDQNWEPIRISDNYEIQEIGSGTSTALAMGSGAIPILKFDKLKYK